MQILRGIGDDFSATPKAQPLVILRCRRVHPRTLERYVLPRFHGLARTPHQVEQEMQIMDGEQDAAEHLVHLHEMPYVGTRVVAASGARALLVERA